jgi:hypothetical protein
MTTRFQAKGASSGRLTPSNSSTSLATTNSTLSLLSLTTYGGGSESDQVYLGKINELIVS